MSVSDELLLKLIYQEENKEAIAEATKRLEGMSDAEKEALKSTKASVEGDKEHKKSLLEVNAAMDIAAKGFNIAKMAIGALGDVVDSTVGKYADYSREVQLLSNNLGLSTEETSRLIQVADDYGISTGEVTSALQMMVRRGVQPSIEELAKLSNQYKSINDPVQRAALMTEALGRGWTTLTPMLKEGGQAIRDAAAGQSDALIITANDVKLTEELRIAKDNLGDAVDGLAMRVGKKLIPVLSDLFETLGDVVTAADANSILLDETRSKTDRLTAAEWLLNEAKGFSKPLYQERVDALKKEIAALEDSKRVRLEIVDGLRQEGAAQVWAAAGVKTGGTALRDYGVNVADVKTQLAALEEQRQALFDKGFQASDVQIMIVKADMDRLKFSIGDTSPQIDTLNAKIQRLTDQGFEPESKQIQLVKDEIIKLREQQILLNDVPIDGSSFIALGQAQGILEEKINTTALSMKTLTTQTIFNAAAAGLSSDAALTLAVKMGLVDKNVESAVRAIEQMKAKQKEGDITTNQYADSVNRMQAAIASLTDKNVEITLTTIMQEINRQKVYERGVEGGLIGGRAYGGAVGAGVPYIIGEHGRETYVPQQAGIVVPNNITSNVTNNITTDRMGVALAMARAQQMAAEARM